MKNLITVFLTIIFSHSISAQCVNNISTTPGIYPTNITGCVGHTFSDTLTIVGAPDTTFNVPPFGIFTVPFDSSSIEELIGLPPDLSYICVDKCTQAVTAPNTPIIHCIVVLGTSNQYFFTEIKIVRRLYLTLPVIGSDSFVDTLTVTILINKASLANISVTACDSYTVPSGDETYTTGGIYMDTISNAIGCDSILTIFLTFNNNLSTCGYEPCLDTVIVDAEYLTNIMHESFFASSYLLKSNGAITTGEDITFSSANNIVLEPDFSIDVGATFEGIIEDCVVPTEIRK